MSDLRGITTPEKADMGNTGKIVGAAVVAVAICAGGAYFYAAGTGKAALRNQVVASNEFSSPALPHAAPAAPQPVVAPPPAPDDSATQALQNSPPQAAPVAPPPPPVKTARIRTPKYTTMPSSAAPMPDNNATPATPPAAPPASSLSEQPAPTTNTATPSTPSQDTPAQNVPQQPVQTPDQQNTYQNTAAPQQPQ